MRRLACALGVWAAACGGGSGGTGAAGGGGGAGGAAGAGGAPGTPPIWNSPLDVEVPQGLSVTLSGDVFDPDGDAFTTTVLGPSGVEVSLQGNAVEVHAGFESPGLQEIQLELTDETGAKSHPVLPANLRRLAWLAHDDHPEGPSAREHATVLWDDGVGVAYVLQGSGYAPQGTPLADAWRYDPAVAAWQLATLTGDPLPAAGSRRGAGSPGAGTALLFGGYGDGFTPLGELYRLEPGAAPGELLVTALPSAGGPPPRSLHVFAHDPISDRYVVFGGAGAAGPLGDTWLLELAGDVPVWTELTPAEAPSPRYGAFHGLDLVTGRLLVWSGAQSFAGVNPADDLWALDVRADPPTWSLVDAPGAPPGRRNGCAVLDHRGPNLWVFGGTADGATTEPGLWVLDGRPGKEAWHEVDLGPSPPERSSGFGFFDGARVFFGYGNDQQIYRDWAILGHL